MIARRLFLAALFSVAIAAPSWAASLPKKVKIRQFSELEQQMNAIESELKARGVSGAQGVTLRLQNYLEDVVLLAGKSADISPDAIANAAEEELKKGTDKRAVGSKLVDLYKSNKLSG